jgi:hypothetical protein
MPPSPHHVLRQILSLLRIQPERLQYDALSEHPSENPQRPNARKLGATTALDGLRGIAAFFVVIFHALIECWWFLDWGYGRTEKDTYFLQLPFINLLHGGHQMVAVFFVVGGYVVSLKPLKLIRSQSFDALGQNLTSSLFRRGPRLYLPPIVCSFVYCLFFYTDFYWYLFPVAGPDFHPRRYETLYDQLKDWYAETAGMTNIWTYYNKDFGQPYLDDCGSSHCQRFYKPFSGSPTNSLQMTRITGRFHMNFDLASSFSSRF